MSSVDYIVVGLGNPGREYAKTRHNVGFMALDFIAKECGVVFEIQKFKSTCAIGSCSGSRVLFLKPQTYMNLSGQAVYEAMRFYKIPSERVILIYDDISLPVGKIRIRKKGSHGGHNGVKNVIALSKSDNFPRIKVGVGSKPNENWNLADWVLSKFTVQEMKILEEVIRNIRVSLELILKDNIDDAMNKFN